MGACRLAIILPGKARAISANQLYTPQVHFQMTIVRQATIGNYFYLGDKPSAGA